MSVTVGLVAIRIPAVSDDLVDMNILVPGTEDVRRRLRTYARVMAECYTRMVEDVYDRECLWCGEVPEEDVGAIHVEDFLGAPGGWYCSMSCLLSAA